MKTVGILALQGDFAAHEAALTRAGACSLLVREARQFEDIDGLIIPGGESTTMLKLLHADGLMGALKKFARKKPVFGTCAGAILLAKKVLNPVQESLKAMDMVIERNAYGRQNDSCIATIDIEPVSTKRFGAKTCEAVFIRAPIIRCVGPRIKVLARYNGDPVFVEEGHHLATTFHPELTTNGDIHAFFLSRL
ncbi:MAG: pyridoxal 5'-phosphate synthase glutaminase subunit PdxT [Bdellovibrionales bacterium]